MARNAKNLIGEPPFGRLTVIAKAGRYKSDRHSQWECRCRCGNTITVPSNSLTMGRTTSCGCFFKETNAAQLVLARQGNARKYRFQGEVKTIPAWAATLGIPYRTLLRQLNRGKLEGQFQRVS